jgi:WD40 repeat protein
MQRQRVIKPRNLEEDNEDKEAASAVSECADSDVVCVDGKSTLWRKRFSRRFLIDLNWRSCSGTSDADRFASHTYSGHKDSVVALIVWWERGLVISASLDKDVRVFSLATGQCVRVLEGHTDQVWCLAGDESQDFVASGSNDNTVRLWQVSTGQCLFVMNALATDGVNALAFLPNRVIVSGDNRGDIRVWDGEVGALSNTMTGGGVSGIICLVSDGKRIFSSDQSGVIRLFDLESGACTEVFYRAPDGIDSLVLRGNVLVAGCWDDKTRVWDLTCDDHTPRDESEEFARGLGYVSLQEAVTKTTRVVITSNSQLLLLDASTGEWVHLHSTPIGKGSRVAADFYRVVFCCGKNIRMLDFSQSV